MGLIADLYADARSAAPLVAADAVAGTRFTAIAAAPEVNGAAKGASNGSALSTCGVAYTGAGEMGVPFDTGEATAQLLGRVRGQPLAQVAHRLLEGVDDAAAAALNALLAAQRTAEGATFGDENGLELVAQLSAGKRLAVIGAFPYLKTIRLDAAQSWVLELDPEDDQLPASAAPEVIPQADVVGITGSTLANGTLEGLLALCRPDAFVVVIGPTTPLSPVLFEYGVDVLCGSLAEDPREVLESVAAGGSTRRLPGMRQVSLRR
jgi:hypothetical protein